MRLDLQRDLAVISGDPLALERVFANLLHNALKFTPDGGQVTVSSRQGDGSVAVSVADSGAGISKEDVPLLFGRYSQTAVGRTQPGTGLGLFVAKSLVDQHGGTITVDSTRGTGTIFTVRLFTGPSASSGKP
jgi:signal transduction histidine kinase